MSAIIGSLIPKIEGFQPIPNSVMIPFMEAQSAALAFAFGLNYEYGKRTVRSMSNEKFNSLTAEDITNMSNAHTEIILHEFQMQVPKVMPAQTEIFKQYVTIEKLKVKQNFELMKWMMNFLAEGANSQIAEFIAHLSGGHIGHNVENPPPPPPPPQPPKEHDHSKATKTHPAHDPNQQNNFHGDKHNSILEKYDQAKILENQLIHTQGLITQFENNVNFNAKVRTWRATLERNKAILLQLMTLITALQKNHTASFGHQVTPYSAKI